MANLPNIQVIRTTGGLGRLATNTQGYSGFCAGGVAAGEGLAQLNTVYELNSINDALALGINTAYDTTNGILVYYHISEFFRMNPSGRLYLLLVSQGTTLSDMCLSTSTNGVYQLLTAPLASGQIRQVGVVLNPASGYTPTVTDEMNTDVIALADAVYTGAAINAQALAAIMFGKHMPVRIFIEARDFGGDASELINAAGSLCNNVQLVMLQDNDVAVAAAVANSLSLTTAAVGTVLGLRSGLQIQQSLAYVAVGNLQDESLGIFVNPGLSNGALLSTFTVGYDMNGVHTTGDDDVILTAGFLAPRVIPMYPGVFINNDITATVTSDDFYLGPDGLVVNEAARIAYLTMVPYLNKDVNINKTTGQLDISVVSNWEDQVDQAEQAAIGQNVSSVEAFIDPNQNVLANSTIQIQLTIVPVGYAGEIIVYIGLTNPYQS